MGVTNRKPFAGTNAGHMETLNLNAGWVAILLGFVSGMVIGLFFHNDEWMGGYGSFRRRMIRLGHIAFFGLGFINLLYALSARDFGIPVERTTSILFVIGLIFMPTVCFASAWRKPFRHLFAIPVVSLLVAVLLFLRVLPWE